jgi:hypothetical protein
MSHADTTHTHYRTKWTHKTILLVQYRIIRSSSTRPQWPRYLYHEMSSPAQTLGSCVRISLEACMSVRVSSVFVLSCAGSGLATGLIARPKSPTVYKIYSTRLILTGNRPEGLIRKVEEEVFYVRKILANLWNALRFRGIQNARLHIRGERKIMPDYFIKYSVIAACSLLPLFKWNTTS